MTEWLWDGPQDSDEEIEEIAVFKNKYEKQLGVKFSKNGIKQFCEQIIATENPDNIENKANAELWENSKIESNMIKFYLKKGGSQFSSDQPFIRTDSKFNKVYKMNKLAKMVSHSY